MYSGEVSEAVGPDHDLVYFEKVRQALQEKQEQRETANGVALTEKLQTEIRQLEAQLTQFDFQLDSSILISSFSQWHVSLGNFLHELLAAKNLDLEAIGAIQLHRGFHQVLILTLKNAPPPFLDSLIHGVISMIPIGRLEETRPVMGFDNFVKRCAGGQQVDSKLTEAASALLTIGLLDALATVSSHFNGKNLKPETTDLIHKLAFNNFYNPHSFKKLSPEAAAYFQKESSLRWGLILGDLSSALFSRILAEFLSPSSKHSTEDTIKILPALQFVTMMPSSQDEANLVSALLLMFSEAVEKQKKASTRVSFIKAIEKVVVQLDGLVAASNSQFTKLQDEVLEFYSKSIKWATSEDLRSAAFELAAVVLIVSPREFFKETATDFLQKELFGSIPKDKKKPHIFPGLLRFLRGKFIEDSKEFVRLRQVGKDSPTACCSFTTKPMGDENAQAVTDRLKIIDENLFVKKTVLITPDVIPLAVDIVVQMAASSLAFVMKETMALLLLKNEEGKGPEYLSVGLKALRIIADPVFEFKQTAACRFYKPEKFAHLLAEIPATHAVAMSYLVQLCDIQVGSAVLGLNTTVLEPTSFLLKPDERSSPEEGEQADPMSPTSPSPRSGISGKRTEKDSRTRSDSTGSIGAASLVIQALIGNPDLPQDKLDLYPVQRSISLDMIRYEDEVIPTTLQSDREKIEEVIQEWLGKCELANKNVSYLAINSGFQRIPKKKKQVKPDQQLIFQLYKDVISALPLFGGDDLLFGKNFVGSLLFHSFEELAVEAAHSLQRVFHDHPEKRGSIMSAYLGLLGTGSYTEDHLEYTLLGQLSILSQIWRQKVIEEEEVVKISEPTLEAISSEVDSTLLCILSRGNAQIRKLCFKVLENVNQVIAKYRGKSFPNGLHAAMINKNQEICSRARYAFLLNLMKASRKRLIIDPLSRTLSIEEVGKSEFAGLWQFYLGELARFVCEQGSKITAYRVAQILKAWGNKEPKDQPPPTEMSVVAAYSALNILRISFCGIADQFDKINTSQSVTSKTGLLFENYAERLFSDLISDSLFVRAAVSTSSYFMAAPMIQLAFAELMDWFAKEDPKGSSSKKKSKHKEFVVTFATFLTQHPCFSLELNKAPSVNPGLFTLYSRLLVDLEAHITPKCEGTYANHYCVILAALCYGKGLRNVPKFTSDLHTSGAIDFWYHNPVEDKTTCFDLGERQRIYQILRGIYEVAVSNDKSDEKKKGHQRQSSKGTTIDESASFLIPTTLMAFESLISLGSLFSKQDGPSKLDIQWFFQLEKQGFKVVTPLLCHNPETALNPCIQQSYGSNVLFLSLCHLLTNLHWRQMAAMVVLGSEAGHFPAFYSPMDSYVYARQDLGNQIAEALSNSQQKQPAKGPKDSAEIALLTPFFPRLLFTGLFHLVHENHSIRKSGFALVKKVLLIMDAKDDHNLHEFMSAHESRMASRLSSVVIQSAEEISKYAALKFPLISRAVILHAFEVFSEQKDSEEYLHGAKSLALRLMAPWLVNVAITQEDLEEKGIFIQLLSATFAHTALSRDFISSWSSLAAQPGNIKIATNFLMAALARCPQAFALTAEISSAMYIINARETLEPLLSQLTEQGFEWNRVLDKATQLAEATSIHIYKTLHPDSPNTPTGPLTYESRCLAASKLISEFTFISFEPILPSLSLLVNFYLLSLPNPISEASTSSFLLTRLIEEYVHKEGFTMTREAKVAAHSLLLTIKMPFTVVWSSRVTESLSQHNVLLNDIVRDICQIFSSSSRVFAEEWLSENIRWAADAHMTTQLDNRTLELQSSLIRFSKSRTWGLDSLQKKVSESMLTITQPHSATKILDVLNYHSTLIEVEVDQSCLIAHPALFWTPVSLLNVPFETHPALYRQALRNCQAFLEKVNFYTSGQTLESPFFSGFKKARQSEDFSGIQTLLLQGIFWHQEELEMEALELLLLAWKKLPGTIVDPSPSGLMYTMLYVLPWIYSNLQRPQSLSKMTVALIDAISQQKPKEFEKSLQSLNSFVVNNTSVTTVVFDTLCREIHRQYFQTYARNVVEYLAFVLKSRPKHCVAVVKMAKWFCSIETNTSVALIFKPFLRFLPTVTHPECRTDIMELLHLVFRQKAFEDSTITPLLLDVSGVPEKQEFAEYVSFRGSLSTLYHVYIALCPPVVISRKSSEA